MNWDTEAFMSGLLFHTCKTLDSQPHGGHWSMIAKKKSSSSRGFSSTVAAAAAAVAAFALGGPAFGVALPWLSSQDEQLLGSKRAGGVTVWKRRGKSSDELLVRGGLSTLGARGFIYLLSLRYSSNLTSEPAGRSSYFKIGGTKDMQQRLPAYVTAHPFMPEVLCQVPVPQWMASERRILAAFEREAGLDGGREWRALDADQVQLATQLMTAELETWKQLKEEVVPLELMRQTLQPSIPDDTGAALADTDTSGSARIALDEVHGQAAVAALVHFCKHDSLIRATVVMPEGSDRAAVGVKLSQALVGLGQDLKRILVVSDTLEHLVHAWKIWQTDLAASGSSPWKCLAFVGDSSAFPAGPTLQEAGLAHASTTREVAQFLIGSPKKEAFPRVLFVLGTGMPPNLHEISKNSVDLCICDHAHKMIGINLPGLLLGDGRTASKWLFLTAALHTFQLKISRAEEALSVVSRMDQPEVFGPRVFELSRSAATRTGAVVPLKLLLVQQQQQQDGPAVKGNKAQRRKSDGVAVAVLRCMEKRGFRRVFVFHATDADMNMFHEELVHEAHRSDYVVSSQRVGNNLPYKERRAMYAETGEARPVVVSSSLPFDEEMGLDPDLPAADMVVILRGCTDTLTALTLVLDLLAKPSPGKRSGFIMVPLTKQQASAESGALPKAAVVALAALVQHGGPRLFESLKQFAQRRAMLGRLLSSTEWPEELQTVLDLESEVSAEAIFHVADLAASRLAPAWSSKLGLLMAFRLREGSVEVPAKHAESGVELHKWLREQHAAALQGQLDEEQLQQLRALGVELAVDCEARVTEEWERRFRQLEDFHHAEGGSDVEGLSRWLKMQRSRAKRGSLKKKQRLRLSQLGVNFEQPGV